MFIKRISLGLTAINSRTLYIDRKRKIIIPFLFKPPRHYPHAIAQAFIKYPELLSRLVCATPRAFLRFCLADGFQLNTRLLRGMTEILKKENTIDIILPIVHRLHIQKLGSEGEFFALTLLGGGGTESIDKLFEEFFTPSYSDNPIIKSGIEAVRKAMHRNDPTTIAE